MKIRYLDAVDTGSHILEAKAPKARSVTA